MLSENKSRDSIKHGEEARDHDVQNQAKRGLTPHYGDVAGKSDDTENKKDAQQKGNEGGPSNRFPNGFAGGHKFSESTREQFPSP
jgi:hypothetical protein